MAELSYWYGFDVGGLPRGRQAELFACLPRIKAVDRLRTGQYDSHDYQQMGEIVLAATGSEEEAQRAKTQAAAAYVRAETERARMAQRVG